MNRPIHHLSPPPDLGPFSAHNVSATCRGVVLALTLATSLLSATTLHAATPRAKSSTHPPQPTHSEVAEKRGDLKELRDQIESLRKEVTETESKRASATDQLKGVEQEISVTQRDLHVLSTQRSKIQETLKDLSLQSRELESRLTHQQSQLEKLVYRQYLRGNPDALQIMLNGDDPNQVARDLHYLSSIGKARSQLVHEIEATLQRKQHLAAAAKERGEALATVEAKQKEQHEKLVAQREQRKAMLGKISAKIAEQRREIGNLQRDEKRLTQLIDRLVKIIATKPVPRKESRPTTQPRPEAGKPSGPELVNENTPGASSGNRFEQLRGSLHLPVRGTVTNRFGAARQEGSTWKGLFIRAATGAEVRAIAAGRVVFADWMRGFGNLIIVDHGGSYLSVYGNNDALLKQVGDPLRGGEVIAAAGNSGGNPESGLYFELRHNGQPLDPLRWVSLK